MEADAYERINTALTNRARRTNLPVRSVCGIDRVVWSVWDYIVGPELRFVWDISLEDQLAGSAVDSDSEASVNSNKLVGGKAESLRSSGSADGGRSHESAGEFITYYHESSLDPMLGKDEDGNCGNFANRRDVLAEIHACGRCLKSGCPGGVYCEAFNEKFDGNNLENRDEDLNGNRNADTSQMTSSTCSPGDPLQSSQSTIVDSEASDHTPDGAPLANLRISLAPSTSSSSHQNESGIDSSFITSQSTANGDQNLPMEAPEMSPLSAADDGRLNDADEHFESRSTASTVDNATDMTDEQYVAVHTLSSEIYRNYFSDDVEFKLISVTERKMATAAYVFAAKHRDQAKAVHSLAFIMKDRRLPWFMNVKPFCTAYFEDWIPRVKAAFFVETYEEVLTRMTTEFTQMLNILGELETQSFTSWAFRVSDTLLSKPKLSDDDFLRHCIAAHLQCQGRTVVVGNTVRKMNRMLRTLGLFMPNEDRILCKCVVGNGDALPVSQGRNNAFETQNSYCPYLKLQGFPKTDVHFILQQAVYSHWPVCIIDIDLETVAQSLPYRKHADLRRRALRRDVSEILKGRTDGNIFTQRPYLAEMKTADLPETMVKRFLQQLDLLPYDNPIREGFIQQFMRYLGHRAVALEVFVRDSTENGQERNKLRISKLRKALDLESDGNFMTVLAVADRLRPGLTEFLMLKEAV